MHLSPKEKLAGFLYGYAIGDALGVGTEFMTKPEAKFRYPEGLRHYSQIYRDAHRAQFTRGHWTLDTDLILLLIDDLVENSGHNFKSYAAKIHHLYCEADADLENHLRWIAEHPEYIADPHEVSKQIWTGMSRFEAPNESLGRAAFLGVLKDDYQTHVSDNIKLTHWDTRCICTGEIIAEVVHSLFYNDEMPSFESLLEICNRYDQRTQYYLELAYHNKLDELDLDDDDTFWYTRKAMASGLWALWHAESPEHALYTLVDEAGDADTNAALALGLMGLRDGMQGFPPQLIEDLVGKEDVERRVVSLASFLS